MARSPRAPAPAHRALTTLRQIKRDLCAQLGPVEADIAREALAEPDRAAIANGAWHRPGARLDVARGNRDVYRFPTPAHLASSAGLVPASTAARAARTTAGSRRAIARGCGGRSSPSVYKRSAVAIRSPVTASFRRAQGKIKRTWPVRTEMCRLIIDYVAARA